MANANTTVTLHRPQITSGAKWNRLTAVEYVCRENGRDLWRFKCDCGTEIVRTPKTVLSGNTKSCGCLASEVTASRNRTHGMSKDITYISWRGMMERCRDVTRRGYGERGISVCESWMSFENFYVDMGPRPSSDHTIDRIDNDGNYEPGNCRWATNAMQSRNTSRTTMVTYNGETMCAKDMARKYGIGYATFKYRITHGWSVEDAISVKPHTMNRK